MIRIVLDTNVFVSGIFWSGPPYRILDAWRARKVSLVYSPEILDEYLRVGKLLSRKYQGVDILPFIDLLTLYGELFSPIQLKGPVTLDPDDDKFIACALGSSCRLIVSGDKHLLDVDGFNGLNILKPAKFVNSYLK